MALFSSFLTVRCSRHVRQTVFASRDPAGNGIRVELIAINSTLILCPIRRIRNRSTRVVPRFHSRGVGHTLHDPTCRPLPERPARHCLQHIVLLTAIVHYFWT